MGTSAFDRLWDETPAKQASSSFDAMWDAAPGGKKSPAEKAADYLRAGYQGLTFGLGNKLTAATRAILPQAMGGTEGFDYAGALADETARLDAFRREHPYQAAAAEGIGGAVPALVTAGASAAPMTLGRSVKAGATYGAMYGAGEPTNPSPTELAVSTAGGAVAGGVMGGVVHGATRVPGAVMDYTGWRPTEASTSPAARAARAVGVQTVEERAPNIILERLRRGGKSLADVEVASADATSTNKPTSLIESGGTPMARLARGTQGVPGRGAEQVRAFLEGRRREAPVRVGKDVEQGLGKLRRDTHQQSQQLVEQQVARAKPFYAKAMKADPLSLDTPVPDEQVSLGELLRRPSAQKAIGYEGQLAKEEGRAPFPGLDMDPGAAQLTAGMTPEARAKFAAAAKEQGVEIVPDVTMEQMHNLKLRLDEMIGYAKNRGELPDGTPATKKMLKAIQDTKNSLLKVMDAHSPDYKKGRATWAGDAELQDGLALGEDFLNAKRPLGELSAEMAELSDAGREQVRVGVVSAVRNKIDEALDGADVVRRIFGSQAQRDRIRLAFPDEGSYTRFRQQMEVEAQMAKNENFVMGNSQTAEKMSDASDIMGQAPPATFSPTGIASAVARSKAAEHLRALAEQRVDALAPYLTASTPAARAAIIAKLKAAAAKGGGKVTEQALARILAGQAAGRLTAGTVAP